MRPIRLAALLLVLSTAVLDRSAAAQDTPQIFPTRDVSVVYRMNAGQGRTQDMTLAWLAASRSMRVDMPGGLGWMVADHRAQRGFMVMEQMRMVMNIPMQQAMSQAGPSPNARYRRTGTDTVAGTRCTVWNFEDGSNRGNACITDDGVMLRMQGSAEGQAGSMEAVRVTYGAQDASRFQRPAGYQTMQMPQGMPNIPGLPGMPGK